MSCGDLVIRGHAIEVRLYAEDPSSGFLPSIGPLLRFIPPEGPGIRLDTGVRQGDEVTHHYDPMLAKLIVWAPSRTEALERMRRALDEFVVLGTTTNLRFLRTLCDVRDVVNATTTTTTISENWPNGWQDEPQPDFGYALATYAEQTGLHRRTTGSILTNSNTTSPPNPFETLNRRFPS